MSGLVRWVKFNVVGVVGVGVQLGTLALLNRWAGGRYLWATAAALELTLLHNFAWHVRYTWRDRVGGSGWRARVGQMVRFQMSNGVVSLVGNLVLMRLLVERGHLPVVVANAVAIAGCSVVNFGLGERWAFAGAKAKGGSEESRLTAVSG